MDWALGSPNTVWGLEEAAAEEIERERSVQEVRTERVVSTAQVERKKAPKSTEGPAVSKAEHLELAVGLSNVEVTKDLAKQEEDKGKLPSCLPRPTGREGDSL